VRRLILLLPVLLLVAACSANVPLPGGAPPGPSYVVTAEFADVLDLVPRSAVKVNDVTVGSVTRIYLAGWTARVELRIGRNVKLPANATAAVRQTSLLGEKYVALDPPTGEPATGQLTDGALIPVSRTRRSVEVEEVLAALGMLLNGGGLEQVKTINEELGRALDGRESEAKDALNQLDTFIGGLDQQKADIVRALDAMDRLTGHLADQRAVIGNALDALAPGLTVLEQQRRQLTAALTSLGQLGQVGTKVINASRDDTLADLEALRPILGQLAAAGDALPKSLNFLVTFPFPANAGGAISGDYANLSATVDLDATTVLSNLLVQAPGQPLPNPQTPASQNPSSGTGGASPPPTTAPKATQSGPPPRPTLPTLPPLPVPLPTISIPGVLPLPCLPGVSILLPPHWTPLNGCTLPPGCQLLGPGDTAPAGSVRPPGGVIPAGTIFPAGTLLVPGTVLTPGCLLPPTGNTTGQQGSLGDILGGGLLK
jgi:phospholipid/cholesterol/gamma-HCH transport system substrate-binding protein